MKRILSIFTTAFVLALTLTSCADTEVKLSKNLDGTWDITSFKADGQELMGTEFTTITFTFVDGGEGMGTLSQSQSYEFSGQTETETYTGTYQITSGDDSDTLSMTVDGDTITGTLELDGNTMTYTFTIDGETGVLVGERQ